MKKYLLPILIMVVAGLVAANLFLSQRIEQKTLGSASKNPGQWRRLTLKAPGMFCLGCTAAVEGFIGRLKGVKRVQADLASKKVQVIYDPKVIDKNSILDQKIFDAYGRELVSDQAYTDQTDK